MRDTSNQPSMLEVIGLKVAYGPVEALNGVDITVRKGEIVTLLGANGAGKSSTLNALVGLAAKKAGSVTFAGKDISAHSPEMIVRMGMTLTPEGRRIFPTLTVDEHLLLGGAMHKRRGEIAVMREEMLSRFPILKERLHQKAGSLSGGEQQMLAIGRALMTNPRLLVLDEATEGLAPVIRQEIWARLKSLKEQGLAMLVIDKEVDALVEFADRHYVLEKGEVVWSGNNDALVADATLHHRFLGL